eukprot:4686930-Prymnesium_polylepis.1
MSAHERGREDAGGGAGRAAQGGEGCRHFVVLYTGQTYSSHGTVYRIPSACMCPPVSCVK